ncbi:MAG: extracellular solute-binding protein [Alphaproteobacteria bacterium]|nr:extracellular solute-binding protein [Alphaproteobacteria bacterium]
MRRILVIVAVLAVIVAGALYVLWPRQSQGLVLYSAVDYGPAVAAAFKQQTGIDVTLVDVSTGALLAKVSAEGHRPAWSLLWFDGDLAAAALDRAGLLAKHSVPDLPWNKTGRALIPADGAYTPTGLTLAGAFTYHATLAAPPAHWAALLSPALKGAVGMNNPAISGPMYPLLAGMLQQAGGWPKGQAYVLALKANGLHVYTKNANTLAALRGGDIGLAVTQSSAAWYTASQDPMLRVRIPDPAFALPSVICAAPGLSPQMRAAAEKFIRFAMSPAIQKLRQQKGEGDGNYWPLTKDVAAPKILPPLGSLSVTVLDPALWGPREDEVNAWFSKTVLAR